MWLAFPHEPHKTLHYAKAQKQRSPSSQLSLNKIVIASARRISGSYLHFRHANLLPFILRRCVFFIGLCCVKHWTYVAFADAGEAEVILLSFSRILSYEKISE